MRKYLNGGNIPLAVAVFLATDNYDYDSETLSATSLIKPLRQLILSSRVPQEDALVDISNLVKSRLGNAIHDGIERAWLDNYDLAMKHLGYPERLISRVKVNPTDEQLKLFPDAVPVYLEQRMHKSILGKKISGKFDFVAEGQVEDFKSTSVFTYVNNTKEDDYILQGSIYRWLDPKKITSDQMRIHFIFMDFQASRSREPGYPANQVLSVPYKLMSLEATEAYVSKRIHLIDFYKDAPEDQLPLCTDKELWRKAPHWKYYKNPEKMSRSTKNFDTAQEAYARQAADKSVGIVVERPGEVVACKYCPGYSLCSQKDALIADGSLII